MTRVAEPPYSHPILLGGSRTTPLGHVGGSATARLTVWGWLSHPLGSGG